MNTPFDQNNQDFSDKAHEAAQSMVYPALFKCDKDRMRFERVSVSEGGEKAILDGQMAIDRVVKVTVDGLRCPIEHIVQERFRRPQFSHFKDVTITEFNHASGQPSELYKIKSGIFVYGYYDENACRFGDILVVDVPAFMMAMTDGSIEYVKRQNRKMQDFVCVSFDDLHRAGVVVAHMKPTIDGHDNGMAV